MLNRLSSVVGVIVLAWLVFGPSGCAEAQVLPPGCIFIREGETLCVGDLLSDIDSMKSMQDGGGVLGGATSEGVALCPVFEGGVAGIPTEHGCRYDIARKEDSLTSSGCVTIGASHWSTTLELGKMFDVVHKSVREQEQQCKAEWIESGLRLWCEYTGRIDIVFSTE